jgi:hypothetical protein
MRVHGGPSAVNEEAAMQWLNEEERKESELASVARNNPFLGTLINQVLHREELPSQSTHPAVDNQASLSSNSRNMISRAVFATEGSLRSVGASEQDGSTRGEENTTVLLQQQPPVCNGNARKRNSRNQTPEEREARKEAERARKTGKLANESFDAREVRLRKDRERKAAKRARIRQESSAEQLEAH